MVKFLDYDGLGTVLTKIKGTYVNMMGGNEFNFIGKSGWNDNGTIAINYRKPDRSYVTKPITNYTFYNGSGQTSGVSLVAETFNGKATSAGKLLTDAGSSAIPVYFSGGKPVQCNTTLNVSITGNAATATSAGSATSAGKLSLSGAVGSLTQPVYFTSGGTPVACTYSLNKTVPANAEFTDTKYTASGGITLDSNRNFTLNTGYTENDKNYAVKVDKNGKPYVSVPWTDANTKYTAGSGLALSSDNKFSIRTDYQQTDKTYPISVDTSGRPYVSVAWEDTKYSAATSSYAGVVTIGSNITNTSGKISITSTNVTTALGYTPAVNSDMKGATSATTGTHGLVPAPTSGQQSSFLCGNGTWATPSYASSAGTASKIGTGTTGSTIKPVYIKDGVPTECSYTLEASVPSTAKFTDTTYTLSVSNEKVTLMSNGKEVSSGTVNNVAYATSAGSAASAGKLSTDAGSANLPVYFSGGKPTQCSTTLNVSITGNAGTVNGHTVNSNVPANAVFDDMKAATSATTGTHGLVPAPGAGKQSSFLRGDGTWATPLNTTYSDMKGATSAAAGTHGLVPAPGAGQQGYFLTGGGTWAEITKITDDDITKLF